MLKRIAVGVAALAVVVGGLSAPAQAEPRHPHPPRCQATYLCLYPSAGYQGEPLVLDGCGFTDLEDTDYDDAISSFINKVPEGTAVVFYDRGKKRFGKKIHGKRGWYELFTSVARDRDSQLASWADNKTSGIEIAC